MENEKNIFSDDRFNEIMKKAKNEYFLLPKELYCLSLNENIKITRAGWNHIVNKKRRSKNQSYFRVKNLKKARFLIETINLFQDVIVDEKKDGKTTYWILQAVIEKVVIEVVIRQIGNQPKHFYSLVYKGGIPRNK